MAQARQKVDDQATVIGAIQSPVALLVLALIQGLRNAFHVLASANRGEVKGRPQREVLEKEQSVTVHKHVEKDGLTMELVTADHASSLGQYAEIKSLSLPPEAVSILERYMDGQHSFVLTWISEPENLETASVRQATKFGDFLSPEVSTESIRVVSAAVSFPAKHLYYPLVPTSVYGARIIPASIKVEGFVTPRPGSGYADSTKTTYWYHDAYRRIAYPHRDQRAIR